MLLETDDLDIEQGVASWSSEEDEKFFFMHEQSGADICSFERDSFKLPLSPF